MSKLTRFYHVILITCLVAAGARGGIAGRARCKIISLLAAIPSTDTAAVCFNAVDDGGGGGGGGNNKENER